MVAKTVVALRRLGTANRSVAETVSFALAHRFRIEILAALHEGPARSKELADTLRQPLSTVDHHLKELLKDGSIEIARVEKVGNLIQHFYCMVKLPFYSNEDVAAMSPEERQALAGLILQASMAEALASLWAGKIISDPRVMLAWNRVNLDRQGREDLADEQDRSWARQHEIEAESANRLAETGELGVTYVITSFGYERSRTSAPEPIPGRSQSGGRNRRDEAALATNALSSPRRLGTAKRNVAETVSFALAHRFRIEILAALHEGPASSKDLAETLRQPLSTVGHHLKELLEDGSIEIAKVEKVGNVVQHFYCMVKLPFYSDEDVAAMSPEERQALAGMILQASMAEALASLWAGKMHSDPRVMLAWNRINLDRQGRNDLADEQARSLARLHEIEAESANRLAETGEPGVTYVITSFGYERSRTSAPAPAPLDMDINLYRQGIAYRGVGTAR